MDLTSILDQKPGVVAPNGNSNASTHPDGVFHLPSPLTHLQEWLIAVLLGLHRQNLTKLLEAETPLKEEAGSAELSDSQLLGLLASNWRSILQHPYLLVDHFVPKNFILMEPSPTLVRDSGKFKKFDQLISKLEPLEQHVIVVAKTGKEIDLIESYLLGRRLNYRRYTGVSLYDNGNTYKDQIVQQGIPASNAGSFSGSVQKGSGGSGASSGPRFKKSDDYFPRLSASNPQVQYLKRNPKDKLTVHLISSNMIKTFQFNANLNFHLIISFDSQLGDLTYFRQLKSARPLKLIPVLKLVQWNSLEHVEITEPDLPLLDKITRALKAKDTVPVGVDVDVEWLKDPDSVKWPVELEPVGAAKREDAINILNLAADQHGSEAKKAKTEEEKVTLEGYKGNLTRMIKDKLGDLNEEIVRRNEELDPIRAEGSETQRYIEEHNLAIANLVRSKQQLEVQLGSLVKRVEKLDADAVRLQASVADRQSLLDRVSVDASEIVIDGSELEALNDANEKIRVEYQENSSKAAEISMKLNFVTAENAKVKEQATDTKQQVIANNLQKTNGGKVAYALDRLAAQNEFLTVYGNKINTIIKNNNIADSSSSRTTSSRLSRSSTPRI